MKTYKKQIMTSIITIFFIILVIGCLWNICTRNKNVFFFPNGKESIRYDANIYPLSCEEIQQEITLNITEIATGENGILYKMELEQPPVEDELDEIRMGRRYLGYYYVTKDNIYLKFVSGMDGYTEEKDNRVISELTENEEAFIETCYIVCSNVNTDKIPDENGYYTYVELNGDQCTFYRYNKYLYGTKDYYKIVWEKEKGMVYYLHGAGNRLMEIELLQQ